MKIILFIIIALFIVGDATTRIHNGFNERQIIQIVLGFLEVGFGICIILIGNWWEKKRLREKYVNEELPDENEELPDENEELPDENEEKSE